MYPRTYSLVKFMRGLKVLRRVMDESLRMYDELVEYCAYCDEKLNPDGYKKCASCPIRRALLNLIGIVEVLNDAFTIKEPATIPLKKLPPEGFPQPEAPEKEEKEEEGE